METISHNSIQPGVENTQSKVFASRDDLLYELREHYELAGIQIRLAGMPFEFWRPADPNCELTDAVLNKRHDEMQWHPYWAQAWDAWRGVADRLTELPLAGLSVLDLGCGLGMTGAVAAACGAKVTMGDNAVPSLQFARLNSWPWRERAQIKLIDWNHDTLGGKFDLIVGCDIVYERQQVEPLDRFFRNHLAARSGKSTQHAAGMVLLGDPTRIMTRDFLNRFAQLGWHQSESSRRYPGIDNPIRLVEMRLELD